MIIDNSMDAWTEEQILQAVKTLLPNQRLSIVGMNVDRDTSHSYVLVEWQKRVPACFVDESIQLTEDIRVQVIHTNPLDSGSGGQKHSHTCGWVLRPKEEALVPVTQRFRGQGSSRLGQAPSNRQLPLGGQV